MPDSSRLQCLAFTTPFNGIARTLKTKIAVVVPDGLPNAGESLEIDAIWDTGATSSAISKRVVDALKLPIMSMARVHHANGEDVQTVHQVSFALPNRLLVQGLLATCAPTILGADALVGMDVIGSGDLAITIKDGKTMMSFHFPPREKQVDYVPLADAENKRRQKAAAKANRRSVAPPPKHSHSKHPK